MSVTSVASSASSATLIDANGNRRCVTITNTDANALYVLLDKGTASATNYTVKLATDDYYEVPERYTGDICGVWAADGSGAALITEY